MKRIDEILIGGLSLDFKTINGHSPLAVAVVQNNTDLVELLERHGADLQEPHLLHRAAQFGADRVVRLLVETKGIPIRRTNPSEYSVLAAARASRHSGNVVPMLTEMLRTSKDERLPQKTTKELSEEAMLEFLKEVALSQTDRERLEVVLDAIFVEERSLTIQSFYSIIEDQAQMHPELVFACIELIRGASTTAPKDATLKQLPKGTRAHHGNLTILGRADVGALLVTGDLRVEGELRNLEGCQLFVGGDCYCQRMVSQGPVIIGGTLNATRISAANNDYALEVKGAIEATTLEIEPYKVVRSGRIDVENRIER